MSKIIYVSGPYTRGDVGINIYRAIKTADRLLDLGYAPFLPVLTHLWHLISPKTWDTWLQLDKIFLAKCDALLRLDGDSMGADIEVELAEALGIPIYYDIEEIKDEEVNL